MMLTDPIELEKLLGGAGNPGNNQWSIEMK